MPRPCRVDRRRICNVMPVPHREPPRPRGLQHSPSGATVTRLGSPIRLHAGLQHGSCSMHREHARVYGISRQAGKDAHGRGRAEFQKLTAQMAVTAGRSTRPRRVADATAWSSGWTQATTDFMHAADKTSSMLPAGNLQETTAQRQYDSPLHVEDSMKNGSERHSFLKGYSLGLLGRVRSRSIWNFRHRAARAFLEGGLFWLGVHSFELASSL